jgi:ABC-2 type transport system ATP-binding protein
MAVIEVRDLRKRYGSREALAGVTFDVRAGEIFGIVGPNGAGKTTAVEIVAGLRRADSGHVSLLGTDPGVAGPALRQRIGVQLQHSALPNNITVGEALRLYASFYRQRRTAGSRRQPDPGELMERWGLAPRRDARFATLSGGWKQRLFLALALVGDPEVAFLDELTTGLDPKARRETWDMVTQVRQAGVTVVLVSHHMDEVERLCDRVAVFGGGRIVALDTPSGLVTAAAAEQVLRFRPVAPLDEALLAGLPGVTAVTRQGEDVVVTGTGDVAGTVTGALARARVLVANLRIDTHTLDEAYLALTGAPGTEETA